MIYLLFFIVCYCMVKSFFILGEFFHISFICLYISFHDRLFTIMTWKVIIIIDSMCNQFITDNFLFSSWIFAAATYITIHGFYQYVSEILKAIMLPNFKNINIGLQTIMTCSSLKNIILVKRWISGRSRLTYFHYFSTKKYGNNLLFPGLTQILHFLLVPVQ